MIYLIGRSIHYLLKRQHPIFRIGEGKLRKLVSDNPNAEYLLWNGNRVQIKRTRFEKFIDTLSAI